MNFNWIIDNTNTKPLQKSHLDLEYSLRAKITRYLLMRLDNECEGDFSSFYFDVDMIEKKITISDKTSERFRQLLLPDFDQEIGCDCC